MSLNISDIVMHPPSKTTVTDGTDDATSTVTWQWDAEKLAISALLRRTSNPARFALEHDTLTVAHRGHIITRYVARHIKSQEYFIEFHKESLRTVGGLSKLFRHTPCLTGRVDNLLPL